MTSTQLDAALTSASALRDNPSALKAASGWFAWLLGHGHPVTQQSAVELGYSVATLGATIKALKDAGWVIDRQTVPHPGRRSMSMYRALRRPDGTEVVESSTPPPRPPAQVNRKPGRTEADRQRDRDRAHQYRQAKKNGAVKGRTGSNGNGHVDLLRVAPDAPPLGALVRIGMVAEQNGDAVLALHDQGGRVWWARLEPAPA